MCDSQVTRLTSLVTIGRTKETYYAKQNGTIKKNFNYLSLYSSLSPSLPPSLPPSPTHPPKNVFEKKYWLGHMTKLYQVTFPVAIPVKRLKKRVGILKKNN